MELPALCLCRLIIMILEDDAADDAAGWSLGALRPHLCMRHYLLIILGEEQSKGLAQIVDLNNKNVTCRGLSNPI